MIIFNFIGLAMVGACFAIAYVFGWVTSSTGEDVLMVIAGPLLFICDMLYRRKRTVGTEGQWWYHHRRGGQLFFIPIWVFGLLWMLLGTFRLLM